MKKFGKTVNDGLGDTSLYDFFCSKEAATFNEKFLFRIL